MMNGITESEVSDFQKKFHGVIDSMYLLDHHISEIEKSRLSLATELAKCLNSLARFLWDQRFGGIESLTLKSSVDDDEFWPFDAKSVEMPRLGLFIHPHYEEEPLLLDEGKWYSVIVIETDNLDGFKMSIEEVGAPIKASEFERYCSDLTEITGIEVFPTPLSQFSFHSEKQDD